MTNKVNDSTATKETNDCDFKTTLSNKNLGEATRFIFVAEPKDDKTMAVSVCNNSGSAAKGVAALTMALPVELQYAIGRFITSCAVARAGDGEVDRVKKLAAIYLLKEGDTLLQLMEQLKGAGEANADKSFLGDGNETKH